MAAGLKSVAALAGAAAAPARRPRATRRTTIAPIRRAAAPRPRTPNRAPPAAMASTGSSGGHAGHQASSHDVPPEGIARLMSPEEFTTAVEGTRGGRPAIVMCKSKSCRPCRAFNTTYYTYAKQYEGRIDFYEIYGDESGDTIKLMVKASPPPPPPPPRRTAHPVGNRVTFR